MNIGFLGCGKMGSALALGLVEAGVCLRDQLLVTDISAKALTEISAKGIPTTSNAAAVARASEAILVCVKPQEIAPALSALQAELSGKLVISIAAGVSLASLQKAAGESARVVRVMPNTPALIHKGASGYALGKTATDADAALVDRIFSAVGQAVRVKEELLDVVTGLSGSGPAYVYLVVEALSDAGVLMGLPRDLSLSLAAQTVAGAAEMVIQTKLHPAQLKDMVTSPGGTTIAGLEQLEAGGLRHAFLSAVRAATERSRELGKS